MNDELQVIQPPSGGLSIEQAFQAVVAGTIKAEHVAVMRELLAMDAERKFNAAFVQLKMELPAIRGVRGVPDKHGNIKFVYANFDDIDLIVGPICLRHGFSYSFRESAMAEGRVTMTMTLQHSAGHSREIPFSVRVGTGPPGASDSQADMSGHTYAKRGCLESGLSLRIIGDRDDARMEGNPNDKITPEEADALSKRVLATKSSIPAFLKFCGAECFSEITRSRYAEADAQLRRKERAALNETLL